MKIKTLVINIISITICNSFISHSAESKASANKYPAYVTSTDHINAAGIFKDEKTIGEIPAVPIIRGLILRIPYIKRDINIKPCLYLCRNSIIFCDFFNNFGRFSSIFVP